MTKPGGMDGPGGLDQPAKGRGAGKARGGQGAPAARVRRVAPAPPVAPAAPLPTGAFTHFLHGLSDAEVVALLKAAADRADAREALEMEAKVARIKQQLADGTYVIDEDKLVEALCRRLREWPDG